MTDTFAPKQARTVHYQGHYTNRRGTLVLDRVLGSVGRIKKASGTHDPETFQRLNAELTRLHRLGRREKLIALREGHIRPLDLISDSDTPAPIGRPKRRQLFLYAMRATPSGNIKIGITEHVERRVASIQGNNFEAIELLMAVRCARVDEMVAHQQLAEHRIRGEWYRPSPQVLNWIAACKSRRQPLMPHGAVR